MYKDNTPAEEQQSPFFELMHNTIVEHLFGAIPAFIYILNTDTQRYIYASPNLGKLFGYDHEELLGGRCTDMYRMICAEDAEKVKEAEAFFIKVISEQPAAQRKHLKNTIALRMARRDGTLVPAQLQTVVLETDRNGVPGLMMGVLTEIISGKRAFEFASAITLNDPARGWSELYSSSNPPEGLISTREKEILKLLASGKSSKIIASELSISVNTVNNHRKNMLLKTKATNIAGLLSYGVAQGII
jgi:DNA-binding CsgD family transcriptional regulator